MHYLITGHTGFKGSWLSLLLAARGHTVSGVALDPRPGGLFEMAGVAELLRHDYRCDIRDSKQTTEVIGAVGADVLIHLAAQPLVRESYRIPRDTFETNVMGTLNVLDAVSRTPDIRAAVIVTTDKVYRNVNQKEGYTESDPLGGHDPYSSSKAMADILTQSWVASFPGVPTAVARAGNVIGGGDVSPDRLVPDLITAFSEGREARIRYPAAVRPWQHVLDCLNGYLLLADALVDGRGQGEWNFGPGSESFVPVGSVADIAAELWGSGARWAVEAGQHLHEAALLSLDASKSRTELRWQDRLPFPRGLEWTIDWNRRVSAGDSPHGVTLEQIRAFEELQP